MTLFRFFRGKSIQMNLKYYISTTANVSCKIGCKISSLLNISKDKVEHLCIKHPYIRKLSHERLKSLVKILTYLGYPKKVLFEEPTFFSLLPITLKNRYKVLQECCIENISPSVILAYLPLVKHKTIDELKRTRLIPLHVNLENQLASHMTQWPTSLTNAIYSDNNEMTLQSIRLKIMQRYLELVLDLTKEEFQRGLQTYPTIKHRPLQSINESLTILQSVVMMPCNKIKNNLYLLHADPDNLKDIIYQFQTIAGIDVKEVIRMHPKLATKNYSTLLETRKILEEYGIDHNAQMRCFEIYTLSPDTIRKRLEEAKSMPEFNTFNHHPRFLKMIHYKTKAIKRMINLKEKNKKCISLNILSGSSAHYKTFEKAPGDRLGKGKDLVFCISQCFEKKYSSIDVRKIIRRHPFWINSPLVQVKYVYQQLSLHFDHQDIYENCIILLYPWNKIRDTLKLLNEKDSLNKLCLHESLDIESLGKTQKLSLVLYLLEKNHYFTGNGVWSEEKSKSIVTVPEKIYADDSNYK